MKKMGIRGWGLVLLFCFGGAACSDDPEREVEAVPGFPADSVVLAAARKEYILSSEAMILTVKIESNGGVVAFLPEDADWLSVLSVWEDSVLVSVGRNATDDSRMAFLRLQDAAAGVSDTVRIVQLKEPQVVLELKDFFLGYAETELVVPVRTDVELEVIIPEEAGWIHRKTGATGKQSLEFYLDPNETETLREGIISLQYGPVVLPQKIRVVQMHPAEDGMTVTLQQATEGVGIDVVVLGDGYTTEEIENGDFDRDMKEAVGAFFELEPYRYFRDYFNVYAVYAHSERSGAWDKLNEAEAHTKFSVGYEGYKTNLTCDPEACFEYASKAPVGDRNSYTVILLSNFDRDAGTAYLYLRGAAIAICPVSRAGDARDLRHLVQHEAGGHAFGKLADEYVTDGRVIPENEVNGLRDAWWPNGIYLNVDLTDDPSEVRWKDFIGHPLYPETGIYRGGYYYAGGVWRPSENCIMNRDMNEEYFNAWSRYLIAKRILEDYNRQPLSVDEFIPMDKGRPMMKRAVLGQAVYRKSREMYSSPPVLIPE